MNKNMKSVTEWKKLVEQFQRPHLGRALWQCTNTLVPIFGIWIALFYFHPHSWWISISLAAIAGLFLVRAFIIFHDKRDYKISIIISFVLLVILWFLSYMLTLQFPNGLIGLLIDMPWWLGGELN